MANLPIIQKYMDKITEEADRHRQWTFITLDENLPEMPGSWGRSAMTVDCGASYCLAGAAIAGEDKYTWVGNEGERTLTHVVLTKDLAAWLKGHGFVMDPYFAGADLFDLSQRDADCLFDGDNSLLDLWALAYALTDGAIRLPDCGINIEDKAHRPRLLDLFRKDIIARLALYASGRQINWGDYSYANPDVSYADISQGDDNRLIAWAIAGKFFLAGLPTREPVEISS